MTRHIVKHIPPIGSGVAASGARCRHAALLSQPRHWKLKNNNQFNYPQNIYCGILSCGHGGGGGGSGGGKGTRRDVLLHSVRPFSTRFAVVIAWFSGRAVFTPPTCPRALTYAAVTSIYAYHTDPPRVCHIHCFMFRLPSCSTGSRVCRGGFLSLCAVCGVAPFNLCPAGAFFFSFCSPLSCMSCSCIIIITSPPSPVLISPLQQVLRARWPRTKKGARGPGDDISEIMSWFTPVPSPRPPPPLCPRWRREGTAKVSTNAIPSPVTRHRVASRWASLRSICRRKHTSYNYDSNEPSSATATPFYRQRQESLRLFKQIILYAYLTVNLFNFKTNIQTKDTMCAIYNYNYNCCWSLWVEFLFFMLKEEKN